MLSLDDVKNNVNCKQKKKKKLKKQRLHKGHKGITPLKGSVIRKYTFKQSKC